MEVTGLQELQVDQEHQVHPELQDLRAQLEPLEDLVLKEEQVAQDLPDQLEEQDLLENPELPAQLEL